jgi:hypothetical protein
MALQLMIVEVAMNMPNYMQGKSLLPLLTGQADLGRHKDHVISEFNDSLAATPSHSHGTMYFDGRYKLTVYMGEAIGELYDLESDRGEFVNLWNDPSSSSLKLALMHRDLQAYLATNSPGIHRSRETWSGAGHAPKSPSIYD